MIMLAFGKKTETMYLKENLLSFVLLCNLKMTNMLIIKLVFLRNLKNLLSTKRTGYAQNY